MKLQPHELNFIPESHLFHLAQKYNWDKVQEEWVRAYSVLSIRAGLNPQSRKLLDSLYSYNARALYVDSQLNRDPAVRRAALDAAITLATLGKR
ncbi:hypothetical protein [Xanthomonas sp. 3058]|uniref:hypothetical protein n=1 Tax=Xanthomonas sp. 3058 TaxID=3035314 RepID=UPI00161E7865|nr:hypothetical protein [Xanthomonas sp. 3058]MBB5866196.1 hypothetical protein [Xanthomonas sp. 3058]